MSAPPHDTAVSTSASGYSDGFGRRLLAFEREDGAAFERLYLRPPFSIYERALRDTFARLATHPDPRIISPRSVERDARTGELVAISPFVSGERLTDLLEAAAERARDEGAVPGIDVALGFLLNVLPGLEMLRAAAGVSHGAIAPSRCVFTPDGRVVLTECGFAPVLQRLNLSRERLWREFGVATPPVAGAPRLDETADVSQAALMAVMLIVGRPMNAYDAVDVMPEWLAEAVEIAQIRGSVSFAVNVQRFLQRALPLPGRRPYQTIDSALRDVRPLAAAIGVDLCQAALSAFVGHATGNPGATADTSADAGASALAIETERSTFGMPAPVIEEFVAAFAEPAAPVFETPAAAIEPERVVALDHPEPIAFDPEPMASPAPIAIPGPVSIPEPMARPEPVPEPVSSRRRRWRLKRSAHDTLRSAVARLQAGPEPVPPSPVAIAESPAVVSSIPPAPVVPSVPQHPIAQPPAAAPVMLQPIAAQPLPPLPVFAPLPTTTETLWTAPISPPPAPAVPKTKPVTIAPARPIALKLKVDPPPAGRPTRSEHREVFAGYGESRRQASGSRRLPWKFAAAAAIVMVTVVMAGRAYLPQAPAVTASAPRTEPVTVAAPAPVKTGTIVVQTQPSGARVLLDGSPAGETPLRIVDVAPGRHILTFVTPTATLKKNVKVEANRTLTLDVPVYSGWVAIFAPIVLEVSEEGRTLGTTDQGRLLMPPGRHTLTLTSRDFGYTAVHSVDIEAGEVRSLNLEPTGTVSLNAVPWAEVWIDGKSVGDTPVANLRLPLGNREILFKHPEFGERKQMTRVTAGAPVTVSVDFSR